MKINLEIQELINWGIPFKEKFIIAGPCSAESEEQVMKTARALKDFNVSVIRAGIWKPRTRPAAFEGIGAEGLQWLKAASAETGLPVAVETANPSQVEQCLKHGIDILWLGARTTPNPFAVQEIAESLRGVDVPVMVKNPVNADLALWVGALERLNNAGVKKLMAVHRGFSTYQTEQYRNQPLWRIPIELKQLIPGLPLICDPSHISGKAELVPEVAQKAMDLLFDGLMIEVHVNPKEALSDAGQQLTPERFGALMQELKFKIAFTSSKDFISHINSLRKEIDELDGQIIDLLTRRMDNARKIAVQKVKNDISIFQPDRWNEVLKSRIADGVSKSLSEEFMYQLFQYIHEESIRQQEQVLND
jgi:chorismate mutase